MIKYIAVYNDNKNYYLCGKRNYGVTTLLSEARKFDDKIAAENVIKSSLPKSVKDHDWIIKKYDIDMHCVIENDINQDVFMDSIECIENNINTDSLQYTRVDIDDVKNQLQKLSEQFNQIKNNKAWLCEELSSCDRMLSDVEHYIEFNNFSACDGYKLCKFIKMIKEYRRQVKNEIAIADIIITQNSNIYNDNTYKSLSGLDSREYTPRVLTDLFEDHNINKAIDVMQGVIDDL